MFDSCHEAFLFFRNSPKRQRFLELVIETSCSEAKKKKINGLCRSGEAYYILYCTLALSIPYQNVGRNMHSEQ